MSAGKQPVVLDSVAEWLAVYRAVRLLQRDSVPPLPILRAKIMERYGTSVWSVLLDCPWCLSPYIGVGLWVLRLACPRVHRFLVNILAASAAVGIITEGLDALNEITVRTAE